MERKIKLVKLNNDLQEMLIMHWGEEPIWWNGR